MENPVFNHIIKKVPEIHPTYNCDYSIEIDGRLFRIMGINLSDERFLTFKKTKIERNQIFYPAGVIGNIDVNFYKRRSEVFGQYYVIEFDYESGKKLSYDFPESAFETFFEENGNNSQQDV